MRRLAVVILAFACLFSSVTLDQHAQSPAQKEPSPSIQIKGITDRVVIRRDERGIPYVEAKNDEDLYFGQGYATAADRLWQMDIFRRSARGELAEILTAGPTTSHWSRTNCIARTASRRLPNRNLLKHPRERARYWKPMLAV